MNSTKYDDLKRFYTSNMSYQIEECDPSAKSPKNKPIKPLSNISIALAEELNRGN